MDKELVKIIDDLRHDNDILFVDRLDAIYKLSSLEERYKEISDKYYKIPKIFRMIWKK